MNQLCRNSTKAAFPILIPRCVRSIRLKKPAMNLRAALGAINEFR
jgi:hypothetical protein